jgi:hypoxanthine phosphoribosyltransferase
VIQGEERFGVLIPEERVQSRVRELGEQITSDYEGKDLVMVGILKGASMFLADLSRQVKLPVTLDFLGLASYGQSTESSGVVRITQDLTEPIVGRDVLVVEDIVDTGLTLDFLLRNFAVRKPNSIRVCTLLHKPANMVKRVKLDYVGFVIENVFVVGYGLDFEQRYRNLPYVGYLKEVY